MNTFLSKEFHVMTVLMLMLVTGIGLGVHPDPVFAGGGGGMGTGTITVNSNSDVSSGNGGNCDLREAIANANAQTGVDTTGGDCAPGIVGTNTIVFSAPMTIDPANTYNITSPIILDGTSGGTIGTCSTKSLGVVIDASNMTGGSGDIFNFGSGNNNGSVVKGFVIDNASSGNGVDINDTSHVTVSCNIIGLDQAGTASAANRTGISALNSTDDVIGGPNPGDGNVISGNTQDGIDFTGTSGLIIEANLIGTEPDGITMIGNGSFGISALGPGYDTNVMIGGTSRSLGNIIMGSGSNGVWITPTNQITNLSFLDNTVAGNAVTAADDQAYIENVDGLTMEGNYFGLDSMGMNAVSDGASGSNEELGINNVSNVTIGGSTASMRNYFVETSNPDGTGDLLGMNIIGPGSVSNVSILGNYFGLNVAGTQLGVGSGIYITQGVTISNIRIGGTNFGEGNVFAGSRVGGDTGANGTINISSGGRQPVTGSGLYIYGNMIGTNPSGNIESGYGNHIGISDGNSLTDFQIGGTDPGEANIIAGNGIGILTAGDTVLGNSIFGNTLPLVGQGTGIFNNSPKGAFGDGIDFLGFGNDPNPIIPQLPYEFTNIGPNSNTPGNTNLGTDHVLNHPVLLYDADAGSGNISVTYMLDVPAGTYRVEFFKNPTVGASSSGFGEGEDFIGYDTFTSTGKSAIQTATLPGATSDVITSDATQDLGGGSYGETSEFSNALPNGIETGTASGNETTLADGGAYHIINNDGYLGTCEVADKGDVNHTILSYFVGTGPCTKNNGITFDHSTYLPNETVTATVVASAAGYLNVWIDSNRNGSFQDSGEHIIVNQAVNSGSNTVTFSAPLSDSSYNLRFRYTTYNPGTMLPVGEATDGEVEDGLLVVQTPSAGGTISGGCGSPSMWNAQTQTCQVPQKASAQVTATQVTSIALAANTATSLVIPPVNQVLGSGICPKSLTISEKLKLGAHDGHYSAYTKDTVSQVAILQKQINRILAASYKQAAGPTDGVFGSLTKQGVERLQVALNTYLKLKPLLKNDGIVGSSTMKALNNSCGNM